ncbi:uncharacterized protein BDW70DRAFT_148033 [Aspergillus foveolatus]|uniref:uncharacterized protein n=1 Tax=Aspergillus foveolatus TaxID=210207 RepID=UPI003CCCE137
MAIRLRQGSFCFVDVIDFASWNPSLSYDENAADPNHCQLSQGYEYCLQWIKATATPTTTTSTPSTTISDGITTSCGAFYLVQTNDSCYDIAASYNIALDDLCTWNPALNRDCSGLYPDYYICLGLIGSTTATATTTTTTASSGVSTPTPTQTAMAEDCISFYYLQSGDGCYKIAANNGIALDELYTGIQRAVETLTPTQAGMNGDGCYDIAADNGVTLDNLYSWNPTLNRDCSGLWPDYYIYIPTWLPGYTWDENSSS